MSFNPVVEKQQIKHVEKESSALQQSLSKLAKAGGFSFLESTIDGVANLNPDRKARKQIFLTDEDKKKDRENLLKTLNLWIGVIEGGKSTSEMVDKCKTEAETADKTLKSTFWLSIYKSGIPFPTIDKPSTFAST